MAQLQITIEIDAAPVAGFPLDQVQSEYGATVGNVIDRIARGNSGTFPSFEFNPVAVLVKAVAAAVAAAE